MRVWGVCVVFVCKKVCVYVCVCVFHILVPRYLPWLLFLVVCDYLLSLDHVIRTFLGDIIVSSFHTFLCMYSLKYIYYFVSVGCT